MCSWKRLLLLACTASLIVNVASDDDAAVKGTVDTQATGNTGETEATGDTPGTDSSCGCGGDVNARPGCGTHCINCSNYKKKPVVCPDICYPNGCDCRDGFIYDPNLKECVLPQVCTPTCGANEVYNACINGGCDARNCSQVGKPVPCVKLDPKACINGCICKEGYLRASNGTCVPKDQCKQPPTCKKDEVYTDCKNRSCTPYTCSELGFPLNCDSNCKPGCVCKGSLVRAANGTCVPQDQCPSCGGDKNAGPGCGTFCINCSNYNKKGVGCPDICILNGCACKNGFIYDRNIKKCVLPTQCTPTCEANEMYNACINGGCDARNCSQVGKPVPCVRLDPKACIKGCICKEGYLRASNGTCVPKDQCKQPPTCGANEVYNACINGGCDARNCSQVGKPVPCVKLDPKACINGCICKEGYLRASNGTCVPKDQCEQPQCNKPNEVYDVCPAPCPPRRCDVDDRVIRCAAPPKPGDPACQPGCRCADGYARNATGTCVLRCHCEKPLQCKANEVYDSCPAICPPQVCSLDSGPIFCPRNPNYGDPGCRPACRCIDGYLRNAANVCIPKDKCPKCGDNEVYNSCINGGCDARNCSQLSRPVPCIDPIKCIEGCVCAKGYLRNSGGKCVPTDQCGSAPTCGANEVYNACINGGCDARNCSQVGKPVPCVKLDPKACIKGCICKEGYLRASKGTCVPKDQCEQPQCNKPNEVYDVCPAPCPPRRCDVDDRVIRCAAPPKPGDPACQPGCRCADGYARNATGTCVLRCHCEKPLQCKANEVYDSCPGICPLQKCSLNSVPIFCPRNPNYGDPGCKPACRCIDGYLRNAANVCIPKDKCPKCGDNEVYNSCINGGCDARNCSQLNRPVPCIDPIKCIEGCVCAKGYLRNSDGKCVPTDQCGSATPSCPNGEFYDKCPTVKCDGDYCPKTRNSPQTCPVGIVCDPPRCTCSYNQKRDWKTGKCIAISNCPPFACNGPNEEYQPCPASCPGENCTDYINDSKCPPYIIGIVVPCKPQCKCKTGYFRNTDGVCIIGSKCGPKKSTTTTTTTPAPSTTPASSTTPAPSDLCPGQNEFFDTCIKGCSNQTCDSIGKIYNCPIQTTVCKTGCRCKPGFYRNSNNVCVAESQCPTPPCPEGETYNRCPTVKCDGDYCPKTRNSPQTCPVGIVCDPPRCTCGFNRKRDWKTGKCIAIRDCPPFACNGPNEEYQPCPALCPGDNCTDYINDSKCPPGRIGIVLPCRPQCKCKTGYFRNSDGVCIKGSKCGPKKTTTTTTTTPAPSDLCPGQNEYFDTCIKGCSNQTCDSIGTIYHCPLQTTVCKTGCRCKPGFYRNANNVCVAESQCPQQCGENAYWVKCYVGCSNQTCNEIGKKHSCPTIFGCKSLCRCNDRFWRDKNNKCIAESQCPTPPCPEGETYNRCPTVKCDGDYCPKTRNCPQTCPVGIVCDPPRCTCGFNRKRDWKSGKCIAIRDCPPFACNGPNEEYQPCPALCPGDNCTDYINDSKCPPGRIGIVLPCRPQCKCKTGYFRNSDGVCIIGSKCGPKKSTTTTTKTPINNCDQSTTAVTTPKPTSGDSGSIVASLQAGVTTFTGKFLYDRISASPGENIIISAYSVFTPLSQLALYATGVTLSQLLAVLNVKNKDDIRTGFPALAASYEGQTSVNFSVAAEVLSNINYKLSDAFIKDSQHIFEADAKSIDFADNVKAAADINAWVESKTNDRIKNLVSADMFSAMTRMVLVNAIYFKGTWKYQFDTKNTNDADFYLSDGSTKKTKLMYQKGSFRYGEIGDLDCKVIELPYVGLNFTMFIVLPNKNDGVLETANKLRDSATFNKAYESMYSQTVEVYLPQFEITTSTNLADILKKQNVDQMFNPNDSGLSGILEKPEQVYVSKAVQKAYIKCDETGSEAAAANGVTGRSNLPAPPPPPPKQFRADHAFLFYIRVKTVTVFCGAYIN